mmetsp:Transcript_21513/g.61683  ORF Transcript_21513/g.61683 Transcript_21513/m.61683 type:complete len:127 (-) Transcript_21513:3125-3505(-)
MEGAWPMSATDDKMNFFDPIYLSVSFTSDKELQRFGAYRPCNRTIADEEFLMVQMQLVCVLIGLCSILAMQKQKKATASLFDQRKRINDTYFWQGTDALAGTTNDSLPKGKGGEKAVVPLGNVEMV